MSTLSQLMNGVASFRKDVRGNVAQIFAFSMIPLLGLAGFTIDYSTTLSAQAKLETAADTAALTAITVAQNYIKTNAVTGVNVNTAAINAGKAQALKVFNAQVGAIPTATVNPPVITLVLTGQTFTATVGFSGNQPTTLTQLIGVSNMTLGGTASAALTMARYLDFYVATDVSGSMGLPSSIAGANQLAPLNPVAIPTGIKNCEFACHFPGVPGYQIAKTNNIQLRIDAVGASLVALMQTAKQTQTSTAITSQFQVGLYPFVKSLWAYAPLSNASNNLDIIAAAADYTKFGTLLDNGSYYLKHPVTGSTITNPLGSGGTDINTALNSINSLVPPSGQVGAGTSASDRQPIVFLITDGAQNPQKFYTFPNDTGDYFDGNNSATAMNPSYCTTMKNRHIIVSVLYLTYEPIQNPTTVWGNEDNVVNAVAPTFAGILQSCASPGFFFQANSPTAINDAMQTMFQQAQKSPRLLN